MLFSLSLLFLCSIGVSAVTFTHEFVDNDLISGCRFELGGKDYDLCPLIHSNSSGRAEDEVLEYEWTIDAGVDRSYTVALGGMGRDRECSDGTWICMTKTRGSFNSSQHEAPKHAAVHISIAGKSRPDSFLVDQGINAVASILSTDDYPATPHLNIFFIGGFRQGRAQYARIDFVCDVNAKLGTPFFIEERHDVHIFEWITKHGCSVNDIISILETKPNPDADSEVEGNDLVDKKPSPMIFRQAMILCLIWISPILAALFIILVQPRFRHMFFIHLKSLSERASLPRPLQFRARENRLVRWGQEDISLGFIDEVRQREVDVIVNSASEDGGQNKGLDEYIPLKSGLVRSTKDYGSATPGRNVW